MIFRPCGECTACCSGQLIGNSYGNYFGCGKKCIFLVEEKCTIYSTRPQTCINYQCAWSQHLLDEELRPDKCGIMVSVENDSQGQYLKAIEIRENINYDVYKKIEDAAKKLKTRLVKVRYNDQYNIHN